MGIIGAYELDDKRWWEMYWNENRECTKCGLKYESKKYDMCYNCRPKKPAVRRFFRQDSPDISVVLLQEICKKLEIDTKSLMAPFYKTVKEQMEGNGLKYDPKYE